MMQLVNSISVHFTLALLIFNFISITSQENSSIDHEEHAPSYVDIEMPVGDVVLLSPGYNALVEWILTDAGSDGAKIVAQVLNREYVGATFSIKLGHCKSSEGNRSPTEASSSPKRIGALGSQQFSIDLHPYQIPGPLKCHIVLINEHGEAVAARAISLYPQQTCLCVHTCKCACGEETNLKCEPLPPEDVIAAGIIDDVKTLEDSEMDEKNRSNSKYKMLFHWLVVFHVILTVLGLCIWMHKKCLLGGKDDSKSKSDKKKGPPLLGGSEEEEEEEYAESEFSTSGFSEESHVLYQRPGVGMMSATSVPALTEETAPQSEVTVRMGEAAVRMGETAPQSEATARMGEAAPQSEATARFGETAPQSMRGAAPQSEATARFGEAAPQSEATARFGETAPQSMRGTAPQSEATARFGEAAPQSEATFRFGESARQSMGATAPQSEALARMQESASQTQAIGSGAASEISQVTMGPNDSQATVKSKKHKKSRHSKSSHHPDKSKSAKTYKQHMKSSNSTSQAQFQQPSTNQVNMMGAPNNQPSSNYIGSSVNIDNAQSAPTISKSGSRQNDAMFGGPQSASLDNGNDNDEERDANSADAYLTFMASTTSSRTSFGTWNRRKREQFTAYDYLPQPKRKDSF